MTCKCGRAILTCKIDRKEGKMFQPINSNILVEPLLGPDKTAGGLLLPDSTREEKNEGKVIAVGDGILQKDGTYEKLPVKVGDTVVYHKTAGFAIDDEGARRRVIGIKDVLGKVV